MKKILSLILPCLALTAHAAYTGKIYVDSNHNGRLDAGEKLLPGVAVSDGLNVVKTNAKGEFTLNGYEKTRFIFITTPSGYKTNNKYYIPVNNAVQTYDFGLQELGNGRIAKDGSHEFIHISDTEIFSDVDGQGRWIKNLKDFAANDKAAFILHTGDICYEKGMKAHIRLMNTENMDCPVFYAIGNHDLVKGKYSEELFESLYGPVYYSFNAGNVHYIVTPMAGGDYQPGYTVDQVARWMKNDLAQLASGTPVVIFNHNLLTTGNEFVYGEKEKLDLNKYNLKGWFYGHWHNHYVHRQGKVVTFGTAPVNMGGIDHSTSAYRVMHVDKKGNLVSDLRYTYLDGYAQINSITSLPDKSAGVVYPSAKGEIPVSVNVYSSAARPVKVQAMCLDGNKVVAQAALGQSTDWNWHNRLTIPARYRKGKNAPVLKLRVTAQFSNGKSARDEKEFTCAVQSLQPELTTNWTNMAGNPQHVGIVPDTLGRPLKLAWVRNIGANLFMSSPLVYKGNVYVASVDENGGKKCAVFALDGKTGKQLWRCPVDYSARNSITIAAGKLFAQDISGILYTIDTKDGHLIKKTQMPVDGLPVMDEGIVSRGDTVYAGSGKALCAIDAVTGKTLWNNKGWQRGEGTVSTWSVGSGNLICGVQWSALYANDLKTGKMAWRNDKEGLRFRASSPAVYGGLLYTISDDSFYIIDEKSGRIVVRKKLGYGAEVASSPLMTDKEIVFGTTNGGIIALDNQTLEKKWQFKTSPALVYTAPYSHYPVNTVETTPVVSGNIVYVAASDGCLYGLDVHTGKEMWKQSMGAPLFSTPAISGNSLVVTDFGGNVYLYTAD